MRRYVLLSLFILLFTVETLGIDLSAGGGLSVKNAYLYLFLLALLIEGAARRDLRLSEVGGIHAAFLFLIVYASLSYLFSESLTPMRIEYDRIASLTALKAGLIDHYLFFLAFFYGAATARDSLWIAKYVLVVVVLGNVVTLLDVYNAPDLQIIHQRADGRVSGPLGESNQYGAFLVLFLPILLGLMWHYTGIRRAFFVLASVTGLAVLFLTTSRGAVVGLIGGLVMCAVYLRNYFSLRQAMGLATGLVALTSAAIAVAGLRYGDLLYARFIGLSEAEDLQRVSSGRTRIWGQALERLMEDPIGFVTGLGWNTYTHAFYYATHNTYLSYLFELGIIGLFGFLWLVWSVAETLKRGLANSTGIAQVQLVAVLFGFFCLLVAVFFVNLYTPWLFVWAYLGLMCRLAVDANRYLSDVPQGGGRQGFHPRTEAAT